MSAISALVRRHALTTFFLLSYALSWWAWPLYALGLFPNPVASFGPFVAAIVVLALTEGKAGLVGLFRRMVRWRVAHGWYVVALFLPVVLTAVATVLNVKLGAETPSPAQLGAWPGLFSTFAVVLLVPGVGGAWEEPGWRGYAVPLAVPPVRTRCQLDPRRSHRRLASASHGGWAGLLFCIP